MRQILLALAVSWPFQLFATDQDFSCVEGYREWSERYFSKSSLQLDGASAREREDDHRIWGIYRDIELRRYGPYATEDIRGMLHFLDTKPGKELTVLTEFVRLLESGEACKDGKPAKSWVDILNALRPFAY